MADLGGGTLDFSAYRLINEKPLCVEESAPSRCESNGDNIDLVPSFKCQHQVNSRGLRLSRFVPKDS